LALGLGKGGGFVERRIMEEIGAAFGDGRAHGAWGFWC
jgi:hypothetical protein